MRLFVICKNLNLKVFKPSLVSLHSLNIYYIEYIGPSINKNITNAITKAIMNDITK